MGRQLWLAARCRQYGLEVVEVDGWQTRGSTAFDPWGVVCHHTAGAATGEMPSLKLLINGRSDLPGPLCNVGHGRSGKVYIMAAGRANHAGAGGWRGLVGNSSVLGIESESSGTGGWTRAQRETYPVLAAALKSGCRSPSDFSLICGHKEWAPKRKIDPFGIDMPSLRLSARGYEPFPVPPALPAPVTYGSLEDDVQTTNGFIGPLDSNGNGWWDSGLPLEAFAGCGAFFDTRPGEDPHGYHSPDGDDATGDNAPFDGVIEDEDPLVLPVEHNGQIRLVVKGGVANGHVRYWLNRRA